MKVDTHLHTKLSDGAHPVSEVADQAVRYGCHAIAITDHGDRKLSAATPEYARAIQAARDSHPKLVILAGLEWNIPPWGGDDHATLLVPQNADEWRILAEFKERFDDWSRPSHDPVLADQALRWLAEQATSSSVSPVVLWNHPSRKRDTSIELVADLKRLRSVSDLVIGFEGSPGHQRAAPLGDYRGKERLIDRWDPAVARLDDAWDVLLRDGLDVWAALAGSDLHQAGLAGKHDYWPGEFSETWLYAPERSEAGVLKALRAGCFFAAHGHIVREVEFMVDAPGLPRPAYSGEVIEALPGTQVTVYLRFITPELDWLGKPNRIDDVELFAITAQGAEIAAQRPPEKLGSALVEQIEVPDGGLVVRARGRRRVEAEPALMFYTNPIRILAGQSVAGGGPGAADRRTTRLSLPPAIAADGVSVPMVVLGSLLVSVIVGVVYVVTRKGAPRMEQARSSFSAGSVAWPGRRHYLLLFLLFSAIAVWGSLVPLRFQKADFADRLTRFGEILSGPVGLCSRSDFVANLLLYVPIGGFLLGGLAADRRSRAAVVLCVPLALLACALLSAGLEFAQLWFRDRTSSKADVLAQFTGSVAGVTLWLMTGPAVTDWLRSYSRPQRPEDQVDWLLQAYSLGLLIYSLLPFDFTVSPAEMVHKYRQGKIQLVPFGDVSLSIGPLYDLLLDGAIFVPVGMLAATWLTPARRPVRSVAASTLIGALIALAFETGQLLVYSRFASTTDVIAGTVGAALGSVLMRRWRGGAREGLPEPAESGSVWRAWLWLALAAGYSLFLVAVFCAPFEPIRDVQQMKARLEGFLAIPFASYYRGSPFNAMFDIIRKLVYFAPLGALLARAGGDLPVPRPIRRIFLALMLLVAVGVGTSIEMIQVFLPPHVPDITDVIVYATGSALGMGVTARVVEARRAKC